MMQFSYKKSREQEKNTVLLQIAFTQIVLFLQFLNFGTDREVSGNKMILTKICRLIVKNC